ncbi:MAG: alkaline phosphatase D family protein [Bacteroidota bacterium]
MLRVIRQGRAHVLLAGLMILVPCFAGAQTLSHAIAVGGVTDQSARFWMRLTGAGGVTVQVDTDQAFSSPVSGSAGTATPEGNFAVIVDISGLQADTRYYYRAVIGGTPHSRVGAFMTFPTPGTRSTFTFAFGSCQQNSPTSDGNLYRQVVKEAPRFFLQLGDWGYPDTTDNLPGDSLFFAADYASVQATYLTRYSPDYPMDSLLRIAPVDYVYDDHDFMNNNASATTSSFEVPIRPNAYGADFIARDISNPPGARENSIRGYKENVPTYPLVNESRGIYHKFTFGNAELFMLDLRAQRSSNMEIFSKNGSTGQWEITPVADHTILGRDTAPGSGENQLSWFLSSLQNSTATWKFIVSSVPFNKGFATAVNTGIALQNVVVNDPRLPPGASPIAVSFELVDKWVGFPADVDTVLNFITENGVQNVIVLSGDSHTAAMDDGENAGLPEIMAGGLDITNSQLAGLLASFGINIWNQGGQGVTTEEYNDAFGRVTVFGEDSVRLTLVDEFGTEFASYTLRNALTGVVEGTDPGVPLAFALEQNYPNPFNPATLIRYSLPVRSAVTLTVYNLLGQVAAVLVDENQAAGEHRTLFSDPGLPSGAYFYRLTASPVDGSPGFVQTRKMVIVR